MVLGGSWGRGRFLMSGVPLFFFLLRYNLSDRRVSLSLRQGRSPSFKRSCSRSAQILTLKTDMPTSKKPLETLHSLSLQLEYAPSLSLSLLRAVAEGLEELFDEETRAPAP